MAIVLEVSNSAVLQCLEESIRLFSTRKKIVFAAKYINI
jgi:hypothetical protein